MPVITRRLIQVGLLAVTIAASAGDGYLPAVGPAPLRFELPASPKVSPAVVLPPLVLVETNRPTPQVPPMASIVAEIPSSVETNAVTSAGPVEPLVLAPEIVPDAIQTNAMQDMVPLVGALNPQMFMHYFTGRPGTNSSGVSIFTPVSFVPPVPVPPPSSSAAFQTTPPVRP